MAGVDYAPAPVRRAVATGWDERRMPFAAALLLAIACLGALPALLLLAEAFLPPDPPPRPKLAVHLVALTPPPPPPPPETAPPPAALEAVVPVGPKPGVLVVRRPIPRAPEPRHPLARIRPPARRHSPMPVPVMRPVAPIIDPSSASFAPAPAAAATAPPAAPTADEHLRLEARIRAAVQAALVYPASARMMDEAGTARVAFDYRDRIVSHVRLAGSAGSALLDRAAIETVRRAEMPAPGALAGTTLQLVMEINFRSVTEDE